MKGNEQGTKLLTNTDSFQNFSWHPVILPETSATSVMAKEENHSWFHTHTSTTQSHTNSKL